MENECDKVIQIAFLKSFGSAVCEDAPISALSG